MERPLTRSAKRRYIDEEAEDRKSLVLFLLGSLGYEGEADRVARVSRNILKSDQIVEGISRFQFPLSGKTRLMYAAFVGNAERLHFIASLGARVNQATTGGAVALFYASYNNRLDCARLLCDRGAALNSQTQRGLSPIMAACVRGHLSLVILLSERC